MTLITVLERRFAMKDLGKTIAKHRKDHKLKQSQLAIELEKYDIYVKPNTVSAWESGLSQPNSRQLLAICELLDIHDIYTEFIGKNPDNPFRNLNEEGVRKALDYISLLEKVVITKSPRLFLFMYLGKGRSSIQRYLPVPDHFWIAMIMKCTPPLIFQKKQLWCTCQWGQHGATLP